MNAPHIARTEPDAHAKEDAALVALLHLIAEDAGRHGETFVQARVLEAAVALDEHRAGLRLATPAAGTGYTLVPTAGEMAKPPIDKVAVYLGQSGRNAADRLAAGLPRYAHHGALETGTQVRFMAPQGGIGASVWAVKSGKVAAVCVEGEGKTSYAIRSGNQLYEVEPTQILLVSTETGAA